LVADTFHGVWRSSEIAEMIRNSKAIDELAPEVGIDRAERLRQAVVEVDPNLRHR
jgi:hypothetical protein